MNGHSIGIQSRHQALDQRLRHETARPAPDPYVIRDLKKRKLALKDQMVGLV